MKTLALVVSFLFGVTSATAQAMPANPGHCQIPSVAHSMQQVIDDWKSGYNSGDPDKVAVLYAEDATYLTQHFITGIVHGRPAIRAYVKKGTDAHYKIDKIDLLASDCTQNFAYGITRYESTNGDQKAFGVNVVVLKKMKGKWLIVAHEAAVPDAASAIQGLDIKPE